MMRRLDLGELVELLFQLGVELQHREVALGYHVSRAAEELLDALTLKTRNTISTRGLPSRPPLRAVRSPSTQQH